MNDWRPSHTRGLDAFDGPTQVWLSRQAKRQGEIVRCAECPRGLRGPEAEALADLAASCPRNRIAGALPCPCAVNHDAVEAVG